jgi:hypothetical protein
VAGAKIGAVAHGEACIRVGHLQISVSLIGDMRNGYRLAGHGCESPAVSAIGLAEGARCLGYPRARST